LSSTCSAVLASCGARDRTDVGAPSSACHCGAPLLDEAVSGARVSDANSRICCGSDGAVGRSIAIRARLAAALRGVGGVGVCPEDGRVLHRVSSYTMPQQ
jgi:hypothetical protein